MPYPRQVNDALITWLMTAPDAPDEMLTLEDFLHRPDWHQRALCTGKTDTFFSTAPDQPGARQGPVRICGYARTALTTRSLIQIWMACSPGSSRPSGGRCGVSGWREQESKNPQGKRKSHPIRHPIFLHATNRA